MVTIPVMSKSKKPPKPAPGSNPNSVPTPEGRRTFRMVRIPEAFAVALEELAERKYTDLTEEVRTAVREYLERLNMLPQPPASST